jgi:hypothetical protein
MKAVRAYVFKEKNYVFADLQKIIGSANRKKYMIRKSQIRKLLHLRKVHKYKTKLIPQFSDLRFAELFVDRPHLRQAFALLSLPLKGGSSS